MPQHSVVIDATPMLDTSGHRGIGRYVHDLLHGLELTRDEWSKGLDLRVVTALGWTGKATILSNLAAAADSLRAQRGSEGKPIRWKRRAFLDSAVRGADLLHLTEAIGTPMARTCRRSVTCYDLIPLRMPELYLGGSRLGVARRRYEDRRRYEQCEQLVAISDRTRVDMIEVLGTPPEKIVAVTTGIDLRSWSPEKKPDDAERLAAASVGTRPYILFVGQGDQRKGIGTLFRALAEARKSLDVELVWAAQLSPPVRTRFLAEAERAGVAEHVRFVGFASDETLAALYRGSVALVFLSLLEGFGLPIAEAIASGCPVVVVRGSGCDEVAGDAGFNVSPGDYETAGRTIVTLGKDCDERKRRVQLGLSRAPRFDRREMARGYVEIWRRMIRGNAGRSAV